MQKEAMKKDRAFMMSSIKAMGMGFVVVVIGTDLRYPLNVIQIVLGSMLAMIGLYGLVVSMTSGAE